MFFLLFIFKSVNIGSIYITGNISSCSAKYDRKHTVL